MAGAGVAVRSHGLLPLASWAWCWTPGLPNLSWGAQDKGSSDVDAGEQAEESTTTTDSLSECL